MRQLVSPKWLGRHLLVLVGVAVFLRLGWWQWQRTESTTGTLQNFGYALEWPLFAAVLLVAWWRLMRADLRPADPEEADAAEADIPEAAAPASSARPPTGPAAAPDAGPDHEDEGDEELVAYNRYLAWLRAQDEKQLQ